MEAAGERITATTAANNLNKLLQIAGGAVYTDDGEVVQFDVSTRTNVILEVIEEASHKVLVFVPFTHTIDVLSEAFTKYKVTHEIIDGRVPANKRGDIVHQFQTAKDPQVLILQPQAAAHGITLTAADTIIWYSPITSVETYLQGNARINRPGQKNAMQIVHISGSPVEERLYTLLQGNIKNHEKLIELYQAALTL
jgi:SNF2 family DNA or RNA helicase